ncbi:MAG: DNA-binding protein [Bdellovibrionales bacterium]|nr:DNA-binding protein [Massilia sp.]
MVGKSISEVSRQELTRCACDALAAVGKKPSIGLVREWTIATTGAKKGSDGDVQKDINGWFEDLLKLKRDSAIDGLPDAVGSLARDFWRLAVDCAGDALASERAALEVDKTAADRLVDQAHANTRAAEELAKALTSQLDIAHVTIAGRDETIRRLEDALTEARATLTAKDERLNGISDELARTARQYAAGLIELDGARKHSLLQIDQARGESRHWKAEFERVDHENRTTLETSTARKPPF